MVITPFGIQEKLHPGDEIVNVGHVRQDIIAEQQVSLFAFRDQSAGELRAEELGHAGNPLGDRRLGDILRRLDP